MESATVQSSPTILASRLPVSSVPGLDQLRDTLQSISMDDDELTLGAAVEPDSSHAFEFFDLQPPAPNPKYVKTEDVMKRLMSAEHLHFILADHALFYRFSSFLNRYKSHLVPTLIRYLEMRKAMKAMEYANSVVRTIRWPSHTDHCKFTRGGGSFSADVWFQDYAARELLLLCTEALPAFVTYTLIVVVEDCIGKDLTGQGVPVVQDLVGSLAEVFCLTDPSVHDNPIIFASEEFHKTTQYGTTYAIDQNCRFLQGPATDKDATLRIAKACSLGQESNEVLLNYRRDGTPFVNLLMCAPLYDDKGVVRYFIGAQVDVTGLVDEGMGIESFRSLLQKDKDEERDREARSETPRPSNGVSPARVKDTLTKLQELSLMFSQGESDVVNRNIRGGDDLTDVRSIRSGVPTSVKDRNQRKRVIGTDEIQDGNGLNFNHLNLNLSGNPASANLPGVYKHYLLVRPFPSLQIIFVSPSLRIPGLLRTHLFTKVGGPSATMIALESAFRDGASVTAKVLWLPKNTYAGERGRGPAEVKPRFIRCTPLLGSNDRVGVWMVILVPVDGESEHRFGVNGSGSIALSGLGIGRRDNIADLVMDDMDDRKVYRSSSTRAGSRATSVRKAREANWDFDGGFGLKKARGARVEGNGLERLNGGRGEVDHEYAEYLRCSSPASGSTVAGMNWMNGRSASVNRGRVRKNSVAVLT